MSLACEGTSKPFRHFSVNEANLIGFHWLDNKAVFASKQARKNDVILPTQLSVPLYLTDSAM